MGKDNYREYKRIIHKKREASFPEICNFTKSVIQPMNACN